MEALERQESDDDDLIELPSCIDSLVSSANQMQQLAYYAEQYYIKILLIYGLAIDPGRAHSSSWHESVKIKMANLVSGKLRQDVGLASIMNDRQVLESLKITVEFLPFLNELNSFVERCVATIESTIKRSTYHLNKTVPVKSNDHKSVSFRSNGEFNLTCEVKIDSVFVAMMDLIFAIVSLDKTIQTHTKISDSLETMKLVCQIIMDSSEETRHVECELFQNLPNERLKDLIGFIENIQLTLCNDQKSILQQCLDQFQHLDLILSKDKTNNGYKNLGNQFVQFQLFYGENMIDLDGKIDFIPAHVQRSAGDFNLYLVNQKMIPTMYMTSTSRKVFGLLVLHLFYGQIFKKQDRKVAKMITQTLQRFRTTNILHLLGSNCYLKFDEFILKFMPKFASKVIERLRCRDEQQLKSDLSSEFERKTMRVVPWLIRLESEMNSSVTNERTRDKIEWLSRQIALLEHGISLGDEINEIIRATTAIYLQNNKPISKDNLIPMFRLVSLLKSIEVCLNNHRAFFSEWSTRIEVAAKVRWTKTFSNARKRLVSLKYSERKLDPSTTMTLTSLCSRSANFATCSGRRMMSICLSMLTTSLSLNEIETLNSLMNLLSIDWEMRLNSSLNCGHLYWSLPTFGVYYNNAFEEAPGAFNEVHYFQSAFRDIRDNLLVTTAAPNRQSVNISWLFEEQRKFLSKLEDDLVDQFASEFLDKICQELEIELRLQFHKDLDIDNHNPFKRHVYNFKQLFTGPTQPTVFKILNRFISLPHYVENHLNRVCYNLTTIAPQDWFTYDSMLSLARHRYHLSFVNTQLPAQTLDYGLDLLDLTRNLPLFASRYGYDLTNQVFIEKSTNRLSSSASLFSGGANSISSNFAPSSSNQTLNVIQVKHIAHSLQTHGFGLLNSSVNCTYQTMKKLINLFAKQLADDKLKATLSKEYQQLNQSQSINQQQKFINRPATRATTMTFDKANRLVRKFRIKLPDQNETSGQHQQLSQQQQPIDLDSMRQTITHLGNLLAFIRSLKSGALYCASKSADYLPDLDDLSLLRLTKYVESEFAGRYDSESLHKAAENFDQCLRDLDENFLPKTNYFSVIINLFTNILSSSKLTRPVPLSARTSAPQSAADDCETRLMSNHLSEQSKQEEPSESAQDRGHHQTNQGDAETKLPHKSNKNHDHLKLFFLVVPALTINYIDYIINCKERVTSRSSIARFGALICDDGFSIGVAFLLTVLEQTQEFARFEWFKQVKVKLEEDKREIEQKMGDSRYEESLKITASVTLRRLNRLIKEYSGLDYALSSALLFFRSSKFSANSSVET